ncbi:N-acetylmuramoyl-L-alanine amidase [Hyphococcus flavus]|uniref:N-acetylmuramoyl-L-alanine amidase n=1 Tax=Hyphococcus flavus TaxID=1866326 RepID=A0AAE9ZD16_9PROT|nr:N-acetylmuramoyl-L-alanine amidase [Hyphococcus flavus]WDI30378.1 N-acetylmuramoyl-L-alanine amidase [Hyphococcus flavus]
MKLIDAPSPNFDERGRDIDTVVLHYTGMPTGKEALERLCDPQAKVSAHYLVEENGDIYRLVDEVKRAWHAGVAYWRGDIDINARSIGIEIVNPGHAWGYRDFPEAQVTAVIALVKDICSRHKISPARVVGHSDVAPRRKEDPGEKFPWKKLADAGLALAPFEGDPKDGEGVTFDEALKALSDIGYDANLGDYTAGLLAFQRRFCPQSLGQGFDARTRAALIYASGL